MLVAEELVRDGLGTEMKGVVAWCAPTETPGRFRVGVRVYCTDDETRLALCALACAGLKQSASSDHRERVRLEVVTWSPSRQKSIDVAEIWFNSEPRETLTKQIAAANF